MREYSFENGVAVVTGAASGIGAALAQILAERGSDLVLIDRDAERLEAVAVGLRLGRRAPQVDTHVVDLADSEATARLAKTLAAQQALITLLVNNAGVSLGGRFDQVTLDEFDWVLNINFRATVLLTHHLLPVLRATPGSHLVNVSSIYGLIAQAGQSAYASSKFAVRGFTEALRSELAAEEVGVTCVYPGGVRTRMIQNARMGSGVSPAEMVAGRKQWERLLTIDPARAAAQIVAGIEHRRARVLIGWNSKGPDALARLLPGYYGPLLEAATNYATRAHRQARSA
jgi:short-subunit dehydrogenase